MDTRKLKNFAASLRKLTDVATAQAIAKRVAPELTRLAGASFDARETPYGDAWAPGHDGNDVTLVKSGALRSKLTFAAIGTRVRAVLSVPYARYQIGKRRILPTAVMPATWQEAMREIAVDELSMALKGGA